MKPIFLAMTSAAILTSQIALGQSIEVIEREFRDRAVTLTTSDPQQGAIGSGFILSSTGTTVFVTTAYHVIADALAATQAEGLTDTLIITRLNTGDTCSEPLRPVAVWYPPNQAEDGSTDLAIVAAETTCAEPSYPISVAWTDNAPSLGVQMHFIDLISVFTTARLSPPVYLSDTCIRARSCFDGPVVRTQGRFNENDSGSAVFSGTGLVGMVIKVDAILSLPAILDLARACDSGRCTTIGSPPDLAFAIESVSHQMANPRPYAEEGRMRDVAAILDFLENAPTSQIRGNESRACEVIDTDSRTELEIGATHLTITNTERRSSARCTTEPLLTGLETMSCTARIDALSPAVEIWSGPSLKLRCADGNCFHCDLHYASTREGYGTVDESREYEIDNIDLHVGRGHYFTGGVTSDQGMEQALYAFVRALTRLVDDGDDSAFCNDSSPVDYCR